jgi:hypothetical protein
MLKRYKTKILIFWPIASGHNLRETSKTVQFTPPTYDKEFELCDVCLLRLFST